MALENKLKRANIDFSWIYLDKGSPASPRLPSLFLPANPPLPLPRPLPPSPALMPQPSPTPSLTPQGRTPYRGRGWAPSMKKIKTIPSSTFCQKFKFYALDRFSPFRLAAAMELVILYKAPEQSSSSSLCIVKKVEKDFSCSTLSSAIFLFAVLCWLSLVANPLPTHQASSFTIFFFIFFETCGISNTLCPLYASSEHLFLPKK